MSDRTRDGKASQSTTVLDPLRPAVVVRRRVYDATKPEPQVTQLSAAEDSDDDESGPPSSINVGRALASLRADELQRVEELLRADEEEVPPKPASLRSPPPVKVVPTVRVGKTIPLSELAEKMGMPGPELPATLVARGFYALTAKTVLPRETARVIAQMFGWQVEDAPDQDEPLPAKRGRPSRISPKRNKAKATASSKATKTKSTRRRSAR